MFMPFALFAASFCGRRNFAIGVGHIISFWMMLLIVAANYLLTLFLLDTVLDTLWIWFAVYNAVGTFLSFVVLMHLNDRLKSDRNFRSLNRPFGTTTRFLRWVPFFECAGSDREVEAGYEPYACLFIAVVALFTGNTFGLLLLIGAIALAAYERKEGQAEIAASEPHLEQLRRQVTATDAHLRNLLDTAKKIVDDLHFVAVMEGHENPGSPVAQQLDELIRRYNESCPSLVVEQPAPAMPSIELLREVCSRQQSLRIERRLYALRDQDIERDIFERR